MLKPGLYDRNSEKLILNLNELAEDLIEVRTFNNVIKKHKLGNTKITLILDKAFFDKIRGHGLDYAFCGCSNLAGLGLWHDVSHTFFHFEDCENLEEFWAGEKLYILPTDLIPQMKDTSILHFEENPVFAFENDTLYDRDGNNIKTALLNCYSKEETFLVPDTVTEIQGVSFDHSLVKNVYAGNVTDCALDAFYECNFDTLYLPKVEDFEGMIARCNINNLLINVDVKISNLFDEGFTTPVKSKIQNLYIPDEQAARKFLEHNSDADIKEYVETVYVPEKVYNEVSYKCVKPFTLDTIIDSLKTVSNANTWLNTLKNNENER